MSVEAAEPGPPDESLEPAAERATSS
jgi:hypothetical protein